MELTDIAIKFILGIFLIYMVYAVPMSLYKTVKRDLFSLQSFPKQHIVV